MPVDFTHICDNPRSKLHRMWLAHQLPIPALAEGKHIACKLEILNLNTRDTL